MENNVQYRIEVQVKPQIHEGNMAHYWAINQINEDGTFAIAHGWDANLEDAAQAAADEAYELGLLED